MVTKESITFAIDVLSAEYMECQDLMAFLTDQTKIEALKKDMDGLSSVIQHLDGVRSRIVNQLQPQGYQPPNTDWNKTLNEALGKATKSWTSSIVPSEVDCTCDKKSLWINGCTCAYSKRSKS